MEKKYVPFQAALKNGQIYTKPAHYVSKWGEHPLKEFGESEESPLVHGRHPRHYYLLQKEEWTVKGEEVTSTTKGWEGDKEEAWDVKGHQYVRYTKTAYSLKLEWAHLTQFGLPAEHEETLEHKYFQ